MSGGDWPALTMEDLDRITVRVLREAWRSRPEVRLVSLDGELAVVKDYGRGGTWFKGLMGAYLIHREAAALRRAEGMANVPRLLALPEISALVMSYVEGVPATSLEDGRLDESFFERLTEMVAALHARGIAHGDLEKLDNIMVTPDGEPALVDFTSAILSGANPLAALALPEVMDNDRRAIYKLKECCAPHLLTAAEREALRTRGGLELWFRNMRRYVRAPVKRLSDSGERFKAG
ncbi:MAG TPA: RIO1 family regulatory kinase/ATPase [Armatimonadota bacterium]|nr:RIO1 family regulatory kinase/ATPase [Armatimonadota bacterium]